MFCKTIQLNNYPKFHQIFHKTLISLILTTLRSQAKLIMIKAIIDVTDTIAPIPEPKVAVKVV